MNNRLSSQIGDLSRQLRAPTLNGKVPGTSEVRALCDALADATIQVQAMERELASLRALLLLTKQENAAPDKGLSALVIPKPPASVRHIAITNGPRVAA